LFAIPCRKDVSSRTLDRSNVATSDPVWSQLMKISAGQGYRIIAHHKRSLRYDLSLGIWKPVTCREPPCYALRLGCAICRNRTATPRRQHKGGYQQGAPKHPFLYFAANALQRPHFGELRHCLCGFGDRLEVWAPVPRHELVPARGRPVAGDLGDDVGDVSLRLDTVELVRRLPRIPQAETFGGLLAPEPRPSPR